MIHTESDHPLCNGGRVLYVSYILLPQDSRVRCVNPLNGMFTINSLMREGTFYSASCKSMQNSFVFIVVIIKCSAKPLLTDII